MDYINYLDSLLNDGGFSGRIRALQARCCQVFAKLPRFQFGRTALRRTLGVSLLITALALGGLANGISRKSVLEHWYQDNHPSSAIWEHALASKNFREITRPEELGPFLRSLPLTPDAHHEVWVTQDHQSIVLFEDEPKVFTRIKPGGKYSGSPWVPFGTGWLGFDQVCREIGLETRFAQAPRRKADPLDPRAIRY